MRAIHLTLFVILILITRTAIAQTAGTGIIVNFEGTFSGGQVLVEMKKEGERYIGQFTKSGQTYSMEAGYLNEVAIEGHIDMNGTKVYFLASSYGNTFAIKTLKESYMLTREGADHSKISSQSPNAQVPASTEPVIYKAYSKETWEQKLRSCRLTTVRSGMKADDYVKVQIDLCANGYFNYKDAFHNYMHSSGMPSGYSSTSLVGGGQWSIYEQGNMILLKLLFPNNQIQYFSLLTDNKGRTYLNGQRFYRTYSNSEQEPLRPECK